jgi:trimeric autotransporter adhesin
VKHTAFLFASSLSLATSLHAATLTVTNTGDVGTASTCIAPIACSLRQAINRANSDAASDNIEFAIPGAGPHVISPTTALPVITQPVNINGYSQAGSVQNTSTTGINAVLKIQLSGSNLGGGIAGLSLQENVGSIISGLSITNFSGSGGFAVVAGGAGALTVIGCAIGVTPSFTAAANSIGIVSAANQTGAVRIGTLSANSPRAVNLISQNSLNAIFLSPVTGTQTGTSFIGHNLINVSADGTTFVESLISINDLRGALTFTTNVIGGANSLQLNAPGFIVSGNRINGLRPINIAGAFSGTGTIGGVGALANVLTNPNPNDILFNANLIRHEATAGNVDFSLNRMFVTGPGAPVGIDLGSTSGITANDLLDPDTGPNGLQNFPILTSATRTSATGVVSLSGTLNSLPNRSFRLVFYANPNGVRAGQFLGDSSTDVSTDAGGNASFGPLQLNFGNGTTVINNVTATATLIDNVSLLPFATSEFAASIPIQLVTPPATFTVTSVDDPGNGVCDSSCTLREAIVAANATGTATSIDEIRFNIPGVGPHTIILGSALPILTQSVTIDGYTQPGALVNTDATGVGTNAVLKIEIRPVPAATFSLLAGDIAASNITLRGLSVNSFGGSIRFRDAANTRIEGCWFGVRPNADEALTFSQLSFQGSGSAVFGGADPAQRNIWNSTSSVVVNVPSAQVRNSLFGVMPSGRIAASISIISGTDAALDIRNGICEKNVFATGPNGTALELFDTAVIDNAFGESFDAVNVLTLGTAIVARGTGRISSASHRIRNAQRVAVTGIGSHVFSQAIVGGNSTGISSSFANNSASVRSAISGTTGLGIDLGNNGVTLNDLGDADTGPNGLQNFPVITSAVRNGSTISVTGTLNSNASQNFRILICGIAAEHVSQHGGCDEVLDDQTIVSTDASGNIAFSVTVENNPAHRFVTATASRIVSVSEEQTSEFALNFPITGFQEIIFADGFE